jgi:hypothetical protein
MAARLIAQGVAMPATDKAEARCKNARRDAPFKDDKDDFFMMGSLLFISKR